MADAILRAWESQLSQVKSAWPEDEAETRTRTPAAVAALTGLALAMAR